MYLSRERLGAVELAFTDRLGGVSAYPFDQLNLALPRPAQPDGPPVDDPDALAENLRLLQADFGPGDALADLRQVHGAAVAVVDDATPLDPYERPEADALVTARAGVTLLVRVADCVPIVLADPDARVVGVVHAGREGLVAGVVPAAVEAARRLGAASALTAWIGPHVCGHCYEVPWEMREQVGSLHPETVSTTRAGTPALDLGAGVAAQLAAAGVGRVERVLGCTRERADLYSHRRDGAEAGRLGALVRLAPS
ncbi:polyphenol oxidase family protein [Nocardioides sp. TRM66260-LWL]|uniref:polyphenol oxidase family protein n=1 Tax=Nocardioides sp. TRM66260-LWL TaxID=2874478 RepID=UPI001CC40E6A|nr:polyphenol oxidase family protein [Nocardioides sp. TRM66260-LWL]MBZ5733352.1 polyphenol oxidase family protein [Nocardioides sp. TRM66260-LWL]